MHTIMTFKLAIGDYYFNYLDNRIQYYSVLWKHGRRWSRCLVIERTLTGLNVALTVTLFYIYFKNDVKKSSQSF